MGAVFLKHKCIFCRAAKWLKILIVITNIQFIKNYAV